MEPNKNTSVFLKHYDKSNWKKVRLGDLCSITTGKLDANAMCSYGKYAFFTCAKEVYKIDKYAFDTEALLISGNGSHVGYVHYYKGKFNAYQRTYVLDNFHDNILFIKYFLDSKLAQRIDTEKKSGNTPYILRDTLCDMEIFKPNTDQEQLQIVKTLEQIDNNISNLEKLISKQESIKKTTEFLLLQPKDNWNKVKLGEVVEYYKGNGLSKEKLSSKGTYPCILYGELFTKYTEIINSVYSKTVFMEGVTSCDGDVLMPGSTTTCGEDLAKASAITQDNVLLGGDVIILRPNKKRLDGRFLAYLISQHKKELLKYTQGITIIHLQGNKMLDMMISIPDLETQRSTINHIVAMDKELEHLRSELDKYRNIKKGLMDYFFD